VVGDGVGSGVGWGCLVVVCGGGGVVVVSGVFHQGGFVGLLSGCGGVGWFAPPLVLGGC